MNSEQEQKKEKNNEPKKVKKIRLKNRSILKIALCIAIAIVLIVLCRDISTGRFGLLDMISKFINGEEGRITTVSSATIEKVFEINELSTAEYVYNSIARAYEEDGTTIKYYVAYEGTIKAGIDFSQIEVKVNDEEKLITLSVPEVEIQEATVNPGTLEFIFVDKKSETETIHQEAFDLCQKDLKEKADNETDILTLARANAETMVRALIEPWVMQVDSSYKIEVE